MKNLVYHIRRQPSHVRELVTLGCTLVVVAIVGIVWFRSFQHEMFSLLNPSEQQDTQEKHFTQTSQSLFSTILNTISSSKAQITGLIHSNTTTTIMPANVPQNSDQPAPHPLPVTGN